MKTTQLAGLRTHANDGKLYSHALVFTREFTSGSFVGMTHDDQIGFCSLFDAEEWVSSVNRANKAGKVNYRVTKWVVR